ncbi:MAG: MFS transporter, partial [Thermaerobacter sp.]|nr:MFS transporter [Thermaerobacter sp.]
FLALAGATLLASFSVTVVSAQEILPKNAALAGGLVLGLSGGLGALGLAAIGYLAQVLGLPTALEYVTFLPLAAAALSFLLPGKPKATAA